MWRLNNIFAVDVLHSTNFSTALLISIGHFRVPKPFAFKMRLGAQPLLWKWVLFAWQWKMISMIHIRRLSTYPHFETEARGNSDMAYSLGPFWAFYWYKDGTKCRQFNYCDQPGRQALLVIQYGGGKRRKPWGLLQRKALMDPSLKQLLHFLNCSKFRVIYCSS